jgi:hypothetical protein
MLSLNNAAPTVNVTSPLAGNALAASGPNMTIASPIVTPATTLGITKSGNGVLSVTSNDSNLPATVTGGRLLADADPTFGTTFANVTLKGGTLGGHGTVLSVGPAAGAGGGGTIQPAEDSGTPTVLTTTTPLPQVWNSNTTLSLVLNDNVPGDYSVMSLNGDITLGNAALAGFAGLNVHLDDQFTVLTTTGTVFGKFASPENDPVNGLPVAFVGGEKFDVLYGPHTVVLQRVAAIATVTLSSSVKSPVYGQDVTVSATVTPETGAGTIPNTDSVTFTLDGDTTNTFTSATNNGVAVFDPLSFFQVPLSVGTHTITAVFNGDNTFAPSDTPALINVTVAKANTTYTLTANTVTPVPGQQVTVTATIFPASPGAGVPSGSVQFKVDGNSPIKLPTTATLPDGTPTDGTAVTLLPNGQALIVLNGLTVSQHRVAIKYLGDDNFNGLNSNSDLIISVAKGTANIGIAANPLPSPGSIYGQTVAFTATVSGPVVPSGTVSFYNGPASQANLIGKTQTLDPNGQATVNYAGLSAGAHTITVVYSGNTSYNSGSTMIAYTVTAATTETGLTSSVGTTAFGQPISFTATVTVDLPGQGTPVGTVTFYDTSVSPKVAIGNPVVVNASGVAVLMTSTLGVGVHNIVAVYNGTNNFKTSTSPAVTQTVQVGVLVTPTSSAAANQPFFGQTFNLLATVKGQSPGNPVPPDGELVSFTDLTTGTPLGSAPLVKGTATLTGQTGFTTGKHTIQASYGGDTTGGGSFLANTGSFVLTVNKDNTTTKVTSSAPSPPPVYGSDITYTVTVNPNAPGAGTPTGTVNLYDGDPAAGGKFLGTNTLSGGMTTIDTTALSAGGHNVYAAYADDANDNPSKGFVSQTVAQDGSNTALSESSAGQPTGSAFYGVPVTLTAAVTAQLNGAAVMAGTVSFTDSATGRLLGSPAVNTGGVATLVVSNLAFGSNHTLVAKYNASTNYKTSTSNTQSLTVVADDTGTTVSTSKTPSYVGLPVTFSATVTPANGGTIAPTGTVTFYDGDPDAGGTQIGSPVTVSANGTTGRAALVYSNLSFGHAAGAHNVFARYTAFPSTPYFNTSKGSVTQEVLYNDTVKVTSSQTTPAPVYGQDFTLTATITSATAGASGNFLGSVTFKDGANLLAIVSVPPTFGTSVSVTLANSSLAPTYLTAGTHSITATYSADPTNSDFITSLASPALSQTVAKDATSIAIVNPVGSLEQNYGSPLTFTVTVSPAGLGNGVPTGKVSFYDGTVLLKTVTLDGSSGTATATYDASFLPASTKAHSITAKYAGDNNFLATTTSSPSNVVLVTIDPAVTSTTISATTLTPPVPANATVYGQAISFSATVTTVSGGGVPVGTVTFADTSTGVTLGSTSTITMLTPTSGVATFVYSKLATSATPHTISATLSNTANYQGSSSHFPVNNDWSVTVSQDTTTVNLTSSSAPSVVGQAVSFAATVKADAPGSGTPTGSVTFSIDGTPFATKALVNGVAVSPAISSLIAGDHSITAVYSPTNGSVTDPNFIAGTPGSMTQTVQTQTLTYLSAPSSISNAPVGAFFAFQVTGLDQQRRQDLSANGPLNVILLGGPVGGGVSGKGGSLTFNFVNGIATVNIALSKPGTYNLELDAGNGVFALITISTVNRQQ